MITPRTAVLGIGEVPWDAPVAAADDAGLRGDGFFETVLVRGTTVVRLSEHLDRFERSAAAFGLAVDRAAWLHLVDLVVADVPDGDEASLRLSLSSSGLGITALRPVPATVTAGRDGIRVVTLARGTVTTAGAPWLLTAAKVSSYAVNQAALREARRRGADDALFVDAEGFALEGPTANLLWFDGEHLHTPPADGRSVLPGTVLAAVRSHYPVRETLIRANGVRVAWLLSSLRGAAPITRLDDALLATDENFSRRLREIALG